MEDLLGMSFCLGDQNKPKHAFLYRAKSSANHCLQAMFISLLLIIWLGEAEAFTWQHYDPKIRLLFCLVFILIRVKYCEGCVSAA